MRSFPVVLAFLLLPASVEAVDLSEVTFFVDARAAPGGTGARKAAFARITDALDAGRPLAATHAVTIKVAPGVYVGEPRPLIFDYPVHLQGPTVLLRDGDGLATGEVEDAAILRCVPPISSGQSMVRISGEGVSIDGLQLDGANPQPNSGATADLAGIGVDKATDFKLDELYISGVGSGIIVSASTGKITDSYIGAPLTTGIAVNGGNDEHPTDVRVTRNRVVDYLLGGIGVNGASDPILPLPREPFHTVNIALDGNVVSTVFAPTGPTTPGPANPVGVRFNLVFSPMSDEDTGAITAKVTNNIVSGGNRYPLIVSGGQIARNDKAYHGTLDLDFRDNQWLADPGGRTASRIIITFMNARLGLPDRWFELKTLWKYLQASTYLLRHHGELDACLAGFSSDCRIDNPEIDPCDGRVLGNSLEITGSDGPLPYATFIHPSNCP